MDLQSIATKASKLNDEIKAKSLELAELKLKLIAGGVTVYDHAQVILPAAPIGAPSKPEEIKQARKLAGDAFETLFDRVVTFKAVKNFRDIAQAVLTPAKARKVIELCTGEAKAQVRF